MGLRTLGLYLIGNRDAILKIAATKHALWLGLLFVLSAGFAREYDGEDLLHEPWHLLIPFGASLATCTLLFALLWVVFHGWRTIPNPGRKYTALLTLYWMTAPLAWVYAIPVERLLDPADAMKANLCLLALVAAWRVALIVRVANVLFETPLDRTILTVLLFADTVMIVLITVMPRPLIEFMGGVRPSDSELILKMTTFLLRLGGVLTWPFWALGTLVVLYQNYDRKAPTEVFAVPPASVGRSAWVLSGAALLMGIGILPFTQPEQQRRFQVEQLYRSGKSGEALQALSRYPREAYPPHWDPPPRIAFIRNKLELLDVLNVLDSLPAESVAPWVRDTYRRKFLSHFDRFHHGWDDMSAEQIEQTLDLVDRYPVDEEIDYDGLKRQTWDGHERSEKLKTRINEFLHARGRFLPMASEEKPEPVENEPRSGD